MSPRRSLLASLLLLPAMPAAEKFWIAPECPNTVARGMNEARFVTDLLFKSLGLELEDDIEYLDEPMTWFFGFTSEDGGHTDLVQERLAAISELERTFTRDDSQIRIYCNNMLEWVPDENGATAPDTFPQTDDKTMNTFFKHNTEGIHGFGNQLECRWNDEEVLASTWAYDANRDINKGMENIQNIVIDLCDLLLKDLSATSSDAVSFPLNAFQEVSEMHTIAYTLIHELIHVPFIGGGTIDGHHIAAPSDSHVMTDGSVKLGYYTNNDSPTGTAKLPGIFLGEPHATITNPDSYMYLCMFYRFRTKGWEMQMDEGSGRLVFVWDPPVEGTPDWKVVDGQWKWAGMEWPTDQSPNWTDDKTPA